MGETNLERLPDSIFGWGFWREDNKAGGYTYWTDDNAIGRRFWDDCVDDPRLVFEILDRQGTLEKWLSLYKREKEKHE